MKRELKYAAVGATAFGVTGAACFAWYALVPGDQVILLSILALPADIPFLLMIPNHCPFAVQLAGIVLFGSLQYGCIGYVVGGLVSNVSARNSSSRGCNP